MQQTPTRAHERRSRSAWDRVRVRVRVGELVCYGVRGARGVRGVRGVRSVRGVGVRGRVLEQPRRLAAVVRAVHSDAHEVVVVTPADLLSGRGRGGGGGWGWG